MSREIVTKVGTDCIGWCDKEFVLPNETLFGNEVHYIVTRRKNPPDFSFSGKEFNPEIEMPQIFQDLKDFRPEISYPLFGWFSAAAFAPQIRKKYYQQFPHFCIEGNPGSGKTTAARFMSRALFGCISEYSAGDSNALHRRSLAGTNCIPFFIDEYEHDSKSPDNTKLNLYLRLCWQGLPAQKVDTEADFAGDDMKLVAPVILTTSYGIKDEGLFERTYIAHANDLPKSPTRIPGETVAEYTQRLPEPLRAGFRAQESWYTRSAGSWLLWWLQQDPTEWIDAIPQYRKNVEGVDRKQFGYAVTAAPFLYCAKKFGWEVDETDLVNAWNLNNRIKVQRDHRESVDILMARVLTLGSMMRGVSWRAHENILYIQSAQITNEMILQQKILTLPYHLDRQWFLSKWTEFKEKGMLQERTKVTDINGKSVQCIWIDLDYFPQTAEIVRQLSL